MGAVPRTGLLGRQTLLSASALGARGWRRGRRPEYRQWPTGQGCKVAHGARRASRGGDPRTDQKPTGRQCEYPSQGDHPQNWRATSHGPAGALNVFNTDGILALSAHVAYVFAGVFILYYETMLTYHHQLFLALSILHQESPLRGGRRLSSSIAALWFFERERESESLNTESARLIDCIRRKRVTSYFAMPRTGTFPMRLIRSTAERLLMIRCREIVIFYGDVQIEKHILVFQCHIETAGALSRPEAAAATAPPAVYHLASWEELRIMTAVTLKSNWKHHALIVMVVRQLSAGLCAHHYCAFFSSRCPGL